MVSHPARGIAIHTHSPHVAELIIVRADIV